MARITKCSAKRAGKKDARRVYPPPYFNGQDGRYSDFEKRVAEVAAGEIGNAVEEWRRKEVETLKELNTMVPELEISFRRFKDTLNTHRQQFGQDVAPEPPRRYGKTAILILFLLFIFEGGVNIFTFRFLREPGLTTVIIGLALAFLIPFSGFYAGKILKAREKRFIEWVAAALLVFGAVALILVVAQGRKIGIEARKLDPKIVEETFLIFLFMNILFFAIALWDGYRFGYTYPRLQEAYEELKRRKRQYMNRRARLNDAFIRTLGYARQKLKAAQSLSLAYREANRRARGNVSQDQLPEYFRGDFRLPVQIPREIGEYLDKDDPVSDYKEKLMKGEEAVKKGQDLIDKIDTAFGEVSS